jgi:CubicO group peptidase (beta-lactamase class C family)
VDAEGIAGFLDAAARRGLELHSLMIVRHGAVIAEGWWQPYQSSLRHQLFSLSKSVTATAVGLLIDEGRLRLGDPVVSFFPEELPAAVSPHLANLQVRHLLTMCTGHAQDATERLRAGGPGWVRTFLGLPLEHAPGSTFVYNSAATYMLSAIAQRVSGQTLLQYLTPRLFSPLGIAGTTWTVSPEGIQSGGWGLALRTADIACFGQLYLRQGHWQGRALLPPEWVTEATAHQVDTPGPPSSDWAQGYGYQFWRCRHGAYRGDGMHGQFCVVLPAEDAVVAATAGTDDMQGVLDEVWEHLLPAMGRAGTATADAALRARLEALSLAPTAPCGGVPDASITGRRIALRPNPAGLRALRLDLDTAGCRLTMEQDGGETVLSCGLGIWHRGRAPGPPEGGPAPYAGVACMEPDGALRLEWFFEETPYGYTLRLGRQGDDVVVTYRPHVGPLRQGISLTAR